MVDINYCAMISLRNIIDASVDKSSLKCYNLIENSVTEKIMRPHRWHLKCLHKTCLPNGIDAPEKT